MENKLEKRYGLFTAICMVVGIVIGSGIFFKTESVLAASGGDVKIGVIAMIVVGFVMFICSYAFSIMAQKYEKMNGLVDYAEVTVGEWYAYGIGWFMTFIMTPTLTSVLGWLSARYTCELIGFENPVTGPECMALSALYLGGGFALNALSPRLAGKFQVSGTIVKLVPLLLMAVVGTVLGLSNGQLAANFSAPGVAAAGSSPLMTSIVSLAFAYEGWILTTMINAELKDAKRNLPIALVTGSLIVIGVYVCYYLGICGAISVDELMQTSSQQAFVNVFGDTFGVLLTVFIVVSCLCTMNGLMLSCVRGMYSLAVRGRGPKPELFAAVDSHTNMPMSSTVLGFFLTMVWFVYFYGANLAGGWFGWFNFDSSELPIITLYGFYIPIFLRMFKLKDNGIVKRCIVPTLAILCCVLLLVAAFVAHSKSILQYLIVFGIIMLLSIPFYRKKA